jgi:phage terminase large subunit-like protein
MDAGRYAVDPALFADEVIPLNEKGRPWTLNRHQRRVLARAFRRGDLGELLFRLLLWSEPKKSGKTFTAALLALWWAFTNPATEIIIAANDLEQAQSRVFQTIAQLCRVNPELGAAVTVLSSEIRVSNGTIITAIASDYRGAAGSRHSLVVFDELWGFDSERASRLYEELTPPPTEDNAWVLVVTYAGFTGESKLLETIYQRGLAGARVDEELELYEAGALFMFWSHTPRQPWQTAAYYVEQQQNLRQSTFARLHRNEWVSPEGRFITADLWDGCVDAEHRPMLGSRDLSVMVGVDAATKNDNAAVEVVTRDGDRVVKVTGRVWKPTAAEPLDLEATVEAYLRELHVLYRVEAIYCDPWQLHRSITTLQAAGLPIQEFPQTTANTTRMGTVLFDLLKGRNLRLYPDDELREQALNTIAIETPRGFRIAKEKASKKIDAIVALSMACVAALDVPVHPPLMMW